jgi:hypothetical protein
MSSGPTGYGVSATWCLLRFARICFFFTLWGIALFLAVASGPRFHRLCTVAPPAILICAWLLSQPGRALRLARNLVCLLAIAFALLLPVFRETQWHGTLDLPIGRTVFSDPLEFQEFQWLAQRSHPSELLFNQGSFDLYLSLVNPTASEFITDTDFTRPEQVTAVLQSLQKRPSVLYRAGARKHEPLGCSQPLGAFP